MYALICCTHKGHIYAIFIPENEVIFGGGKLWNFLHKMKKCMCYKLARKRRAFIFYYFFATNRGEKTRN